MARKRKTSRSKKSVNSVKTISQVSEKGKKTGGLFIPAGIFLGLGFGFLFDQLVAGLFIGMGAGFIGMAIAAYFEK